MKLAVVSRSRHALMPTSPHIPLVYAHWFRKAGCFIIPVLYERRLAWNERGGPRLSDGFLIV